MKWHSVKKYRPPCSCKLFAITSYGDIWTVVFTEEHDNDIDGLLFVSDQDNMVVSGITHFFIPDAVEIEE